MVVHFTSRQKLLVIPFNKSKETSIIKRSLCYAKKLKAHGVPKKLHNGQYSGGLDFPKCKASIDFGDTKLVQFFNKAF